jgi:predicted transcriptional regulator
MRLAEEILEQINKPALRIAIASELGCTENTIRNYIADNSDNLTKARVLAIISRRLKIPVSELIPDLYDFSAE